jgi:hypothetical protein
LKLQNESGLLGGLRRVAGAAAIVLALGFLLAGCAESSSDCRDIMNWNGELVRVCPKS